MCNSLRNISISIILFLLISIAHWPPSINISSMSIKLKMIWVNNICFALVIYVIENFQRISTKHFVITINKDYDTISSTMISYSFMDVWASSHPLLVFNDHYINTYIILSNPLLDKLIGMIRRSIIYDDYFEIFVLKIDHWLKIVLISKVSSIVESWHHDTERKLR